MVAADLIASGISLIPTTFDTVSSARRLIVAEAIHTPHSMRPTGDL
jgi:hypothetical protein